MNKSTTHKTHETLTRYHWVRTVNAFDGEYFRVGRYNADHGKLILEDTDNGTGDEWRFDGTKWVCETLTETNGDEITEIEFSGANRCRECGSMHETTSPDDEWCGCW